MGLLEQEPQVVDSPEVEEKYGDVFFPKKENWEELRGDIEFKNVSFRYPDGNEDVLKDFSFENSGGNDGGNRGRDGSG